MATSFPVTDEVSKLVISKVADEAISALQLVTLTSNTNCKLADNGTYDDALVLGVALNGGGIGTTIEILSFGVLEDPFFTYALNDVLFLNSSGTITNTPPTTGFSTTIGQSLGTGAIFITVERPIEL